MKLSSILLSTALALSLAACSAAEKTTEKAADKVAEAGTKAANAAAEAVHIPETSYKDAPTGVYDLDRTHGYIVFNYVHQGFSKPFLRWRDWDSTLNWDADAPENSSVDVTISTVSVDTGVDIFDSHLKDPRWLNVEAFPEATFVSTAINKKSDGHGTMTGDLTLKGITKPVTLDVKFNKAAEGRAPGTYKIGFSARGKINRSEWDLGDYVPVVSDEVDLIIEVEYGMKVDEE